MLFRGMIAKQTRSFSACSWCCSVTANQDRPPCQVVPCLSSLTSLTCLLFFKTRDSAPCRYRPHSRLELRASGTLWPSAVASHPGVMSSSGGLLPNHLFISAHSIKKTSFTSCVLVLVAGSTRLCNRTSWVFGGGPFADRSTGKVHRAELRKRRLGIRVWVEEKRKERMTQ